MGSVAHQQLEPLAGRIENAERAVVARERDHASALAAVAATLEPDLRRQALAAWEAAARAHVAWLDVAAATTGTRCTGAYALLGDGDDRIGEILQAHGVDPLSYARIGGASSLTRPATEATLRALATKTT